MIGIRASQRGGPFHIVVGVTGGIAAYKACVLVRRLREAGADVTVVPTPAALGMVGRVTWQALTGKPVYTQVDDDAAGVAHVRLGKEADAIVVAPTTANTLAKMRAGIADNLLTSTLLVATCPVILAPAMHTEMWQAEPTRENVAALRARGVHVIEPASGRLTGQDSGPGRMPEPEDIAEVVWQVLAEKQGEAAGGAGGSAGSGAVEGGEPAGGAGGIAADDAGGVLTGDELAGAAAAGLAVAGSADGAKLASGAATGFANDAGAVAADSAGAAELGLANTDSASNADASQPGLANTDLASNAAAADAWQATSLSGLTFAISAGGTHEPIDPVRYIGNRSTGRFGVEIARQALARGAKVILAAANVEQSILCRAQGAEIRRVETASQLHEAMDEAAARADVVVMSAAVADYRPARPRETKRKKDGQAPWSLELVENPDILADLARRRRRQGQTVVGFAAETGDDAASPWQYGRDKAVRKGADLMIVNRVGQGVGFGDVDTSILIVDGQGRPVRQASGTKPELAATIVLSIAAWRLQ